MSHTEQEIARLEWKGPCPLCREEFALHGHAAHRVLVLGQEPTSCKPCALADTDLSTWDAIESDSNCRGLARYIERLRTADGVLRMPGGPEDLKNALADTDWAVWADDYAQQCLWTEWAEEARESGDTAKRYPWKRDTIGWGPQVGSVSGRPVCVSLRWSTVGGQRVCFVDPTSELVDYKLVEKWLRTLAPKLTDDRLVRAENFVTVTTGLTAV